MTWIYKTLSYKTKKINFFNLFVNKSYGIHTQIAKIDFFLKIDFFFQILTFHPFLFRRTISQLYKNILGWSGLSISETRIKQKLKNFLTRNFFKNFFSFLYFRDIKKITEKISSRLRFCREIYKIDIRFFSIVDLTISISQKIAI